MKIKNLSNKELLSIEFILDEENKLASPQILYFQISESEKQLLNFAIFNFIHPDIDKQLRKDEYLLKWVINNLKIKFFDGCEIVKERINQAKYIPDIKSSIDNYINHVRFIFKYYSQLNYEQSRKLNNLKLIYHNKQDSKYYTDSASSFYLSDFYKPQYPDGMTKMIKMQTK